MVFHQEMNADLSRLSNVWKEKTAAASGGWKQSHQQKDCRFADFVQISRPLYEQRTDHAGAGDENPPAFGRHPDRSVLP
jgi:hypothetical protein